MEPAPNTRPRDRKARALAFATCLALALPACVSKVSDVPKDSGPIAAQRVVVPSAAGGAKATESKESSERRVAAEAALAQAEAAWRSGDPLTALALANQALREGVPSDLQDRFRDLRVKARGSVVESRVLRLRAVPEKDAVSDGSDVPVRILLRNLTGATIGIPRREGGSSDALFILEITRDDFDIFGNLRTSEFVVRAPLTEDLVLGPGAEREAHVTIGADLLRLQHQGFTVLKIAGTLRPVAVRVGESEFFDALPVDGTTVRIFLPGWEPLAADPLTSLRRAIAKRSPPHVLTCAELLAPTERAEGRQVLRAAVENDPPLAQVCEAALARLDSVDAARAKAETAAR